MMQKRCGMRVGEFGGCDNPNSQKHIFFAPNLYDNFIILSHFNYVNNNFGAKFGYRCACKQKRPPGSGGWRPPLPKERLCIE